MKNKLLLTLTLITPLTTQPFLEDASKETLELLVQAAGATAVVLGVWGTAQYVQKSNAQEANQKLEQQVQHLSKRIDDKNNQITGLSNENYQLEQQKAQLKADFEQFKVLAGMSKNDELLRQELWEHKRAFPTLWTVLNQTENPNATLNDLIQSAKNLRACTSQAINNANAWSNKCSSLESDLATERLRNQNLNLSYQTARIVLEQAKDNAISERDAAHAEIRTMRQALSNSKSTIVNLNKKIQVLDMNLNTAQSTDNDYALAQLQSALHDAQEQTNKLQADYNYLHGLYTQLQESNAALTTSYNAAERERAAIQTTYNKLHQSTEHAKQASITETERLKNYVKELQAKTEEQVRTIERLKAQIEQQPKRAVTITEL